MKLIQIMYVIKMNLLTQKRNIIINNKHIPLYSVQQFKVNNYNIVFSSMYYIVLMANIWYSIW